MDCILAKYPSLDGALLVDGHENALVGSVHRFGQEPIACYDYDMILENLCADMTHDEAVEFFDFNIIGGWVGDRTPCFIEYGERDEEEGL